MKKVVVLLLVVFCAKSIFAQNSVSLDESIEDAANFLNERIPIHTSVAVFNFSSDSPKLSEYIVDELTIALANVGMEVYDRNNLSEVNREIYYGQTGAVNDNTAASYGHDIGVQTVILGSMTKSNDTTYRLRVQAIVVETKRIQAAKTFNVNNDEHLLALLDIKIQMEHRFTNGEKIGFGFKNMLFGSGSFQMEDPLGGGITAVLEIASLSVIAYGFLMDQSIIVYDNLGFNNVDGYVPPDEFDKRKGKAVGMVAGGAAGLVLTWTWGFVRPYLYDKPVAVQKAATVIDHLNIGFMPDSDGTIRTMVMLSYSY